MNNIIQFNYPLKITIFCYIGQYTTIRLNSNEKPKIQLIKPKELFISFVLFSQFILFMCFLF